MHPPKLRVRSLLAAAVFILVIGSSLALRSQTPQPLLNTSQIQPVQGNKQASPVSILATPPPGYVSTMQGGTQSDQSDQQAADLIYNVNQSQVELGLLMEGLAHNDAVRSYSRMVTDDQRQAQASLQSLARQANLTLQLNKQAQNASFDLKDRLSNAGDLERDVEFLKAQVKELQDAIERISKFESKVKDPQLKSYIQALLPVLQKHETEASYLLARLNVPPSGAPTGTTPPAGEQPPMSEQPPVAQLP